MTETFMRIDRLCQTAGINITILCKEIGLSRGTMTDYKMGRSKSLSAETLGKIANYFSVSTDYLLGRTDDPTNYGALDVSANLSGEQWAHLLQTSNNDPVEATKKAVSFLRAQDEDASNEQEKVFSFPPPTKVEKAPITNEDLKFALWGRGDVSDKQLDKIRKFAQIIEDDDDDEIE